MYILECGGCSVSRYRKGASLRDWVEIGMKNGVSHMAALVAISESQIGIGFKLELLELCGSFNSRYGQVPWLIRSVWRMISPNGESSFLHANLKEWLKDVYEVHYGTLPVSSIFR